MRPRPATLGKLEELVQAALRGDVHPNIFGVPLPSSFDLRARFYGVIAGDPALAQFEDGSINVGWGEEWTNGEALVGWLIERGMRIGAWMAVEELRRYFDLPATRGRLIVAVANITVEKPLDLSHGIVMVPARMIPSVKERLSGRSGPTAHSALVRRFWGVPKTWKRDTRKTKRGSAIDFEDAVHALTVLGPYAPAIVGIWSELDASIPFSSETRTTGLYPIHEPSIESYQPASIPDHRREEARRVVSLLLDRSEGDREPFRTPLDRLSLSGRRGRTIDRYLDVGIALESLLAYEDPLTTEIRYRLRVRAARFLGGTLPERQQTAKRVDELYKRRSTVGHGKKMRAEPKGEKEAERRLRDGLKEIERRRQELRQDRELVARLILRALEKGIPDWQAFDLEG